MSARGDHCLFRSRGTDFAFPTETAKEILEKRSYTEIPRGPAGLLGALNLRGEILPLISFPEGLFQVTVFPIVFLASSGVSAT